MSLGNPIDNNWYQIFVVNGKMQVRDLGIIQSGSGRSLREQVDLSKERYRIKPAVSKAMAVAPPLGKVTTARAKNLRNYVQKLKSRDVA